MFILTTDGRISQMENASFHIRAIREICGSILFNLFLASFLRSVIFAPI
jgi:hypothetical protein